MDFKRKTVHRLRRSKRVAVTVENVEVGVKGSPHVRRGLRTTPPAPCERSIGDYLIFDDFPTLTQNQ